VAVPSLHALLDAGHEVVAVATNPDAPAGRGRGVAPSPVARAADAYGIEKLQPVRAREQWFGEAVADLAVDAAVIVAWGCFIPDRLLSVPKHGWINLHLSLLPAWRGAAPVQRAIMAGDTVSGATTFRLVHDMDAGPVWQRQAVAVEPDETAGELLARLAICGAGLLLDTLSDVEAGIEPVAQATDGVSLAPKVTVSDARIDWSCPMLQVHNLVRGTTPAPGAWTMLGESRLKVLRTALAEGDELAPGQLVATRHALRAGTGSSALEIVTVQAPGKPPMAGADWARGARLAAGASLE